MTVGERIKYVRERAGISQVDFAIRMNVSKQTLYKYENNIVTNIPSDKIEAAAKICNVSPAYLMGWTECESFESHKKTGNYEEMIIAETRKLNQKGKMKLLDTAREMACNPLYNPNYQVELAAAHERTDIEATESMRKHDDDIMMDDSEWK